MSRKKKDPEEAQKGSNEYDKFVAGLKKIVTTPKTEVDKREAEWRKLHPKSKSDKM